LDLYRGRYDFTTFSTQVHDFDPGIDPYPNGLFWTVPNPSLDSINLGLGTAHMAMSDVHLDDFFSIPNALFRFQNPVSTPATCSFDIRWHGPVTKRQSVKTPGSHGELMMTNATMSWSARNNQNFSFATGDSPTTSVFAQLGHVVNGIFAE
jgi:hypothetical protein